MDLAHETNKLNKLMLKKRACEAVEKRMSQLFNNLAADIVSYERELSDTTSKLKDESDNIVVHLYLEKKKKVATSIREDISSLSDARSKLHYDIGRVKEKIKSLDNEIASQGDKITAERNKED